MQCAMCNVQSLGNFQKTVLFRRNRGKLDINVLPLFLKNSRPLLRYAVCTASIVLSCDKQITCSSAGISGICVDKRLKHVKR